MAKAKVEVPRGSLKTADAEALVGQPVLLPGVEEPVGVVREAAIGRTKATLSVELGTGLVPTVESLREAAAAEVEAAAEEKD